MTKLTTERLEYYAALPTQPAEGDGFFKKGIFMYEVRRMARQILAYEQAAKNPVAWVATDSEDFPEYNCHNEFSADCGAGTPLYAAPVLPKQPELIGMKVSIDTGSDNIGHRLFGEIVGTSDSNGVPVLCIEVAENNGDMAARAQPVIPRELHSFVTDADIAALHRFTECCDDPESGGHDLEKEQVQRLEKIGALQRSGRISYITDFGDYLISATAPVNAQQNEPQNIPTVRSECISFDALMAAVNEVIGVKREFDATPEKCYQAVPFMNFNSLSRVVEMFRTAQSVSEPYKLEIDMDDADHFSITHLHEIIYGKELIWPEAKLLARFMLDVKQRVSAAPAQESE